MSRKDDIKRLIEITSRRLQKLQEQKALFGVSTEPQILIEIENLEEELKELQNELKELPESEIPQSLPHSGSAPPLPALTVGREETLIELKKQLGVTRKLFESTTQTLVAIHGWAGIGKTTIASAIAHDSDVFIAFPDGILWVSLGQKPSLLSSLIAWGRNLGTDDLLRASTVEEAASQLRALIRDKRILIIIDDVWETDHANFFNIGGRNSATLITTRETRIAQLLAPQAKQICKLPGLTEEYSLELLKYLAPMAMTQYLEECRTLVHKLEGLPLALKVAGHLLNVESEYGFDVKDLLEELREGTKLLESIPPADRIGPANETPLTVAALLKYSTDRLSEHTRNYYAYLAAFAPEPATFNIAAVKAVWLIDDPKPIMRELLDRGLLEHISGTDRYWMHALMVMLAKTLFRE